MTPRDDPAALALLYEIRLASAELDAVRQHYEAAQERLDRAIRQYQQYRADQSLSPADVRERGERIWQRRTGRRAA
jgi:hypothetical protein